MKDYLQALVQGRSPVQGRNLVREYVQARILQAMQRACAMSSLAFQGGTCLRFLYALPRYSEDLDFALERHREGYDLANYLRAVQDELAAERYQVELRLRDHRAVHSGLVRFPGLLHELGLSPHAAEVLAVKVEVDTNPPPGAGTDVRLVRRHVLLRLCHHDQATLLAGKLHAVLQRGYTKGRDLYDLIWYLSDPDWPAPNLDLLNAALRQSGWQQGPMSADAWREAVRRRLETMDWRQAALDVGPFLENQDDLALVTKANAMRLLT